MAFPGMRNIFQTQLYKDIGTAFGLGVAGLFIYRATVLSPTKNGYAKFHRELDQVKIRAAATYK